MVQMIFKFNPNKVGRCVPPTTGWSYHTPFKATIVSAIWYEKEMAGGAGIQHGLRLNFIPEQGNMDFVNIVYAYTNINELGEQSVNESSESPILHNLVPILGLTDNSGENGMSMSVGVVTDMVFEPNINRYLPKEVEVCHEPNMTGKQIGLILYKNSYLKEGQVKSNARIFEVFDLETKQTGDDMRLDKAGSDESLINYALMAEECSQNGLAKVMAQKAMKNKTPQNILVSERPLGEKTLPNPQEAIIIKNENSPNHLENKNSQEGDDPDPNENAGNVDNTDEAVNGNVADDNNNDNKDDDELKNLNIEEEKR